MESLEKVMLLKDMITAMNGMLVMLFSILVSLVVTKLFNLSLYISICLCVVTIIVIWSGNKKLNKKVEEINKE